VISIVTFKWKSLHSRGFTSLHVNILYAMIKRNVKCPFKFFCVTDDKEGINPEITSLDLWPEPVMPETKTKRPQCYKRLELFYPEMKEVFGPRVVCMDLDTVIVKDITGIISTPGEFVGYNKRYIPYQGAFFIHDIGSRPYVWTDFDPLTSPKLAKKYEGSDQAWLSYKLPPGEKVLRKEDGLYCYDADKVNKAKPLPPNCKMVIFRGGYKPHYDKVFRKHKWIQEHYRL